MRAGPISGECLLTHRLERRFSEPLSPASEPCGGGQPSNIVPGIQLCTGVKLKCFQMPKPLPLPGSGSVRSRCPRGVAAGFRGNP